MKRCPNPALPIHPTRRLALPAACLAALGLAFTASAAVADNDTVNIYTTRQEVLIEPVLDAYRTETGAEINVIFIKEGLVERLKSEGINSPADILLTADVGYILDADQAGLLQPVQSELLENAIQANYRQSNGRWFGFSLRARPIMYAKGRVDPADLSTYEALADPKWKGRICIRSSSNVYNQSLVASMILADGAAAVEEWAKAFVANFSREPAGGDRDQILAVAAGECDIAIANTYYLGGMLRSDDNPAHQQAAKQVAVFWPNQDGRGAHVNITGAGVAANAPHYDAAVRFLEFLVGDEAQQLFTDTVNEYPIRPDLAPNPVVASFGTFNADPLPLERLEETRAEGIQIMDRAGWR